MKEMKLTFLYYPRLDSIQHDIIEELSFHTSKLYNTANYECRENGFKKYTELEKMFKSNWHADYLHSHTYQHCLRILEQNWNSYAALISDYKRCPEKYAARPGPPGYKHIKTNKNEIVFTNLAVRYRNGVLLLSLSKAMQEKFKVKSLNFEVSKKLQGLVNWESIQQIRIKWDRSKKRWVLLIIYRCAAADCNEDYSNVMAVDIGLNNLAAITLKDNNAAYIISGSEAKSVNSHTNKKISLLASARMKQVGNKHFKRTKRINNLQNYRNSYMHDYMHKASSIIVDIAKTYKVGTIVVGDLTGIKKGNRNKSFVQVPVWKIYELVKYKAEQAGIKVVKQKENYTSGVSSLDLEPVTKKYYDGSRRVHRGLFVSNKGLKINADINGSLNIMRKYLKDKCIPKPIVSARDKGYVTAPVRIRVACSNRWKHKYHTPYEASI